MQESLPYTKNIMYYVICAISDGIQLYSTKIRNWDRTLLKCIMGNT